jgi:hypothetical protein
MTAWRGGDAQIILKKSQDAKAGRSASNTKTIANTFANTFV